MPMHTALSSRGTRRVQSAMSGATPCSSHASRGGGRCACRWSPRVSRHRGSGCSRSSEPRIAFSAQVLHHTAHRSSREAAAALLAKPQPVAVLGVAPGTRHGRGGSPSALIARIPLVKPNGQREGERGPLGTRSHTRGVPVCGPWRRERRNYPEARAPSTALTGSRRGTVNLKLWYPDGIRRLAKQTSNCLSRSPDNSNAPWACLRSVTRVGARTSVLASCGSRGTRADRGPREDRRTDDAVGTVGGGSRAPGATSSRRQGMQGVAFVRILRFTDAHDGQSVTQARGDPGG